MKIIQSAKKRFIKPQINCCKEIANCHKDINFTFYCLNGLVDLTVFDILVVPSSKLHYMCFQLCHYYQSTCLMALKTILNDKFINLELHLNTFLKFEVGNSRFLSIVSIV